MATIVTDEALRRGRALGRAMTEAMEDLNGALRRVESEIAKMGLGVAATVRAGKPGDFVEFRKDGGKWLLFYNETPLLAASKEARMTAAAVLPGLVEELIAIATAQHAALVQHADALNRLAATIEESR